MTDLSRRRFLRRLAGALPAAALCGRVAEGRPRSVGRSDGRVPLLLLTDLYHPPQDPDDLIDLATAFALPEYDLLGVVLDVTRRFLVGKPEGWDISRDPGFVPVAQLSYLAARPVLVAAGPTEPLRAPEDDAADRPRREQAGIDLLLDVLERSERPVTIAVTGSCRVLTAAFNRHPEFFREKTSRVLLNAGWSAGDRREWNVDLDVHAYVGLWRSGLPIDWYPCATARGAFDRTAERGTYWRAKHGDLFAGVSDGLRGWLAYGLSGSASGDIIGAIGEAGGGAVWHDLLSAERNLWSTASLVLGCGRDLVRNEQGWHFGPAGAGERYPWRLDPISASVVDNGDVQWRLTEAPTVYRLFGRPAGVDYADAMTEALARLLAEFDL